MLFRSASRRTEISAAAILGLSTRHTRRLLAAYRDGGGGAMIHKARGRTSNNQLIVGIREYVIELVRLRYSDFGPSLAAEMLLNAHEQSADPIMNRAHCIFLSSPPRVPSEFEQMLIKLLEHLVHSRISSQSHTLCLRSDKWLHHSAIEASCG